MGRRGWGWLGTVRKRAESEKRAKTVRKRESRDGVKWVESLTCVFWKMVYGNFFRKPFSPFSFAFFLSKSNIFMLTFILRRNKRLQMLKTFYGKRFTSKQKEPKIAHGLKCRDQQCVLTLLIFSQKLEEKK
jgi:hypothetical protein